ncbi:enoyl-CoA hydratase-related protein [Marininema halotolerans]|uniref:Enoyl-CoA hydratase n=1 Tax=Marininema halotolerans TaxID=1155944 RepID=A0A1I6REL0_9BACL|nr:enoyl-CoA hydratase-related protein [Marininema halotolerans]SFS63143.1 enoyl-CoA hydratase [Marininema halotolerans]
MEYQSIQMSREGAIGRIQLYRPKVLNALNTGLISELVQALEAFDRDSTIRCILLTGGNRVFAAGADIGEMATATSAELMLSNQFADWDRLRRIKKPIVAAVVGYALGGGCELAMACDMIVAAENARFGQPEIDLGIIPGAGGTQRLTRAVGKARAMEIVLTGSPITAQEALHVGLVNRVVPVENVELEAMKLCQQIASKAPAAVQLAKESVLKSFDTTIADGLDYEQKLFYLLFSTEDQKEGMNAFVEKRKPHFQGK